MNAPACRVGLIGLYSGKNFGDDLMGIIFARALQDLGVTFKVYGLGPEYRQYGFPTTSSVPELVESSDLIVFGGGGILQPRKKDTFLGLDLNAFLELCRFHSVPLVCLSIGGSGVSLNQITPAWRRRLVEQAEFVTLRLRADLPLLNAAGTKGLHYEDVVWMTPRFFPRIPDSNEPGKRPRICVNMYPHGKREKRLLPRIFGTLTRLRSGCDFVFAESMFGDESLYGGYQVFRPASMGPNCSYHKFESLEECVESIQKFDLVVTNRLHLGMVAMSYGIPCIALFPRPKTVLCYRELGLERFCWERKWLWKLGYLLSPYFQEKLLSSFTEFDLVRVQQSAAHHLEILEETIPKCAATRGEKHLAG